jgi:2-enoate reductase
VAVIGRGLLADPELPNKLAEGRPEDIMPCISCNEGCIGRVYAGKPATCALNPRCGHAHGDLDISDTAAPKRVVIVGAGIGGCMAALYAKAAGHEPVILEKSGRIGGKLHAACKPWFKADMARLITYLETQL